MRRIWLNLVARWRLPLLLRIYPASGELDDILWHAIQDGPRNICLGAYYATFTVNSCDFSVWNTNRWYAYAARGSIKKNGKILYAWDGEMPSPYIMWLLKETLASRFKEDNWGKRYQTVVEADNG